MRWFLVLIAVIASLPARAAQSDLDALMERVLARRDDNWARLQQYVLNERETIKATGPAAIRVFGSQREYLWYPRPSTSAGVRDVFVRSPLTVNAEPVSEDERARFEQEFLERHPPSPSAPAREPGFISAAYFLRFKFDPGQYALVGRESFAGRDVLRIEYYPTRMFTEGRSRPNKELRERDAGVERKMNKSALVTMWVLPEEHQIVKYDFEQIDLDFMPGRLFARIEDVSAAMEMGQPFPDVWLPKSLRIAFRIRTAAGDGEAEYSSDYYDYRLATVDTRVR